MNITKDDIGRTVESRNGQKFKILDFNEGSAYPVHSQYHTWTATGKHRISQTEESNFDLMDFYSENSMSVNPVHCAHGWVGTGFAGGDVWCKFCNVNYNESMNGPSNLGY